MDLDIMDYIKPELLTVAVGLYFVGIGIKKSKVANNYIPLIIGILGIFICALWVLGTSDFTTLQSVALGIFTAITQGLLVAGLSTYMNQIIKQLVKKDKESEDDS